MAVERCGRVNPEDDLPPPRSFRSARLAVGLVLAVLALGTLGGLVWIAALREDPSRAAPPAVAVLVEAPDAPGGLIFEGRVRASTPLDAIERGGEAAGFAVARSTDGQALLAAAGRVDGHGGRWVVTVARDGAPLALARPEALAPLRGDDRVRWAWEPFAG